MGQVDFATTASVESLGLLGDLDIGTLCLDVGGPGTLQLQMQMARRGAKLETLTTPTSTRDTLQMEELLAH